MAPDIEAEKRLAAEAAAALVEDGMAVGLGTGSTVAHLLPALGERELNLRCVATSPATERAARELGLAVEEFETLDRLDIAIDGADQVGQHGWLVKGGGGAHTREKIVAAAADRFVVIADSTKPVERISAPIPLELGAYALASTLRRLDEAIGEVAVRPGTPESPDGGVIADYLGDVGAPSELATRLAGVPGVVEHGLFAPHMVSQVLVGRGGAVERLAVDRIAGGNGALDTAVRRASIADAPDVGRLLHDFNAEFSEPTPGAAVLAERAARLLASEEAMILLAGTGPDGIAQIRFRSSLFTGALDAYLEELYVAPAERGRGLGRALLEAAIEAARREGAARMELGTSETDTAARALYESAGFTNREGDPNGPVMFFYERDL